MIVMTIGTTVGGVVPMLMGVSADAMALWSVVGGVIGGLIGIWLGAKAADALGV